MATLKQKICVQLERYLINSIPIFVTSDRRRYRDYLSVGFWGLRGIYRIAHRSSTGTLRFVGSY